MEKNDQSKRKKRRVQAILLLVIILLIIFIIHVQRSETIPALKGSQAEEGREDQEDQEDRAKEKLQPVITSRTEGFSLDRDLEDLEGEEDEEDEDEEDQDEDEGYILPATRTRLIKEEDVKKLEEDPPEDLPQDVDVPQMIINEIMARHGGVFENKEIQNYFNHQPWYQVLGEYEADEEKVYAKMNDYEKKNLQFLIDHYRED